MTNVKLTELWHGYGWVWHCQPYGTWKLSGQVYNCFSQRIIVLMRGMLTGELLSAEQRTELSNAGIDPDTGAWRSLLKDATGLTDPEKDK